MTAGSKAEGITKYYESDIDRLILYKDVKCLEEGTSDSSFVVFHMDKYLCSPGYTRLVLSNCNKMALSNEVKNCLIEQNGKTYISNRFTESFVEYSEYGRKAHRVDLIGSPVNLFRKHGPCVSFRSENISFDFVAGFKCQSQDLLGKWEQRKRTYDWPNSTLIKEISGSEGHVVPVAEVQSQFPDTEWRICFTNAELLLVNSLNEHHLKVYILLKKLSETALKPICPAITSYIVKNVILWQAENTPKNLFAPNLLLFRLFDALKFLQDCIKCNNLKSYMIEDRNLFFGRISELQKKLAIDKIDQLLSKDEQLIRETKKLFDAYDVFDTPAFIKKAEKEEQIEKLLMKQSLLYMKLYDRYSTCEQFLNCLAEDKEYVEVKAELQRLVIPEKCPGVPDASSSYLYRSRLSHILQW
ncbi:uncharacterized protein LOC132746146 [Ruditapes philippinarum]|uniref:uncharacterized protein LOC132746146 n=1 Tax=Ruditapes philippinarum TaxID=129788 RepID=UPI00295AE727|nr:uncharacterized protein LOC132746146 [Ruditapes philippinarum]